MQVSSLARPLVALLAPVLAVAAQIALPSPARAEHDVQPARIGGQDRFATAAEIAGIDYRNGTRTALLARADAFPDAMAAAALAGELDAPILLTAPDVLPADTAERLDLLGGEAAISAEVERDLARSYDVSRLEGPTRYGTAAEVARAVAGHGEIGGLDGHRSAFVVNGTSFADALAAGAPAAQQPDPVPILLTERDDLPEATEDAIGALDLTQAIVVGGEAVVDVQVEDELRALGLEVVRIAGATRTQTAARVADLGIRAFGFELRDAVLARGDAFPDALAAGPHAAILDAPILLTESPAVLGDPTAAWFTEQCAALRVIQAIGGSSAVAPSTLADAERAGETCAHAGAFGQTYIVAPEEVARAQAGDVIDYEVVGRYDGRTFTTPVNIALFPCRNSDVPDDATFRRSEGDPSTAADIAASDRGTTVITVVNDVDVADTAQYVNAGPQADGTLGFRLHSEAEDCAVVVVYDDVDNDRELDVDDEGRPTEPFGVGKVVYET